MARGLTLLEQVKENSVYLRNVHAFDGTVLVDALKPTVTLDDLYCAQHPNQKYRRIDMGDQYGCPVCSNKFEIRRVRK